MPTPAKSSIDGCQVITPLTVIRHAYIVTCLQCIAHTLRAQYFWEVDHRQVDDNQVGVRDGMDLRSSEICGRMSKIEWLTEIKRGATFSFENKYFRLRMWRLISVIGL